MKPPTQRDENSRFNGNLRHYHRSGSQNQRTWDEWVDGKAAKSGSPNWLRFAVISVAVLALLGIMAGLIIELR